MTHQFSQEDVVVVVVVVVVVLFFILLWGEVVRAEGRYGETGDEWDQGA